MKANLNMFALALSLLAFVTPPSYANEASNPERSRIEVGFSPEGTAQTLILNTIQKAVSSIRLSAYVFTNLEVARALIEAKERGVDVAVVADYRSNFEDKRGQAGGHALTLLAKAGIPTRTIDVYPIHHDKFFVVDGMTVETGSFNFTAAAAEQNSENAIVVSNNADLAQRYITHWQSRWDQGLAVQATY